MGNYVDLVAGRLRRLVALVTSTGAADANKIVQTGADGRLHASLMPTGFGEDLAQIEAAENLSSGDFVNVFDDAGTVKVRKADATAAGKEADGFVLDAVTSGQDATVYFEGTNTALSGLTPGAAYHLSAATPGGVVATPPSATGNVVQYVGRAISATAVAYEADRGVILS